MIAPVREPRFDIPSVELLHELLAAPLPLGLSGTDPVRSLHRDIYFDAPDGTLQSRGVNCRFRLCADDRQILTLEMWSSGGGDVKNVERLSSDVQESDPLLALNGNSPSARRLRGIIDPAMLMAVLQLEAERWTRRDSRRWFGERAAFLYDNITVRCGERASSFQDLTVVPLGGGELSIEKLESELRKSHGLRISRASAYERARLLLKWIGGDGSGTRDQEPGTREVAPLVPGSRSLVPGSSPRAVASRMRASMPVTTSSLGDGGASEFLNSELSLLEFNSRVLALAEDSRTPLLARLRFLAIVSANNDEFFMVRVAGLKDEASEASEERSQDGMTAEEQLIAIALRVPPFLARQYRCYRDCMAELAKHGVRLVRWSELDEARREYLRDYFRDELHDLLTPFAMTLSPGHPFPVIPHLSLSLAVLVLDPSRPPAHFAEVELPERIPRFVKLPGCGDLIAVEEIVRANLHALYPDSHIEEAWMFRVTRSGDLALEEKGADNLLDAVADATTRRTRNAVVRIEVERGMPVILRDLLLRQLQSERGVDASGLSLDDFYEVDDLLDLRCLEEVASLPMPELHYPPFRSREPLSAHSSMFGEVAARDTLVHHPFDDFSATVQRFIIEAANDPDVSAIKLTLYRAGERSPLLDALIRAAATGKEVIVFVELKARFDEARNVSWAKRLEDAGGRVVYGFVGFKNHAKTALVLRRENGKTQRYVHIGTGNYNAASARSYTDLSLFTANDEIGADIADLFNELTGASRLPQRTTRRCLIAPAHMLNELVSRIEREAAHASSGRGGRIRIKANGLSDPKVIRALYEASRAGVETDLIIRGICTLRPGVRGLSQRIRVRSVLGRFLEHSRIFHFGNGGEPEYFIGSADLRPRNLRRRVELLVPVIDPACRAELDRLLDLYSNDASAWELAAHGEYVQRREADGNVAQEVLMRETHEATASQ